MVNSDRDIIRKLSVASNLTMSPEQKQASLRFIQQEMKKIKPITSPRARHILSTAAAAVAALGLVVGLGYEIHSKFIYQPSHPVSSASVNKKNINPMSLHPSSVDYNIQNITIYTFSGKNATPAVKELAVFKVKVPVLPNGFIPYQVSLEDTVPTNDQQAEVQQLASFTTIQVPGMTAQKLEQQLENTKQSLRGIYRASNFNYIQYTVNEYSEQTLGAKNHFTTVPFLKNVTFDGIPIQVYGSPSSSVSVYKFRINNRVVAVYRSAGDYKLRTNALTDQTAWKIIDSLVRGTTYVN